MAGRRLIALLGLLLVVAVSVLILERRDQNPVMRTVPLGLFPGELAVDEQTGRVFVVNYMSTTVDVLDATTGALLDARTVGSNGGAHPETVVVDARTGHAFVTTDDDRVSVFDARNGALLSASTLGQSAQAGGVDEQRGRIFITNLDSSTVNVLDSRSAAMVRTVPVGATPVSVGVDQQTGRVFVVNDGDNTVSVLDGSTGSVVRVVRVGQAPRQVVVSVPLREVFVANTGDHSVSVLDATTGAVLYTMRFRTGKASAPPRVAVDDRTGRAFVAIGNQFFLLDARSGRLLHQTRLNSVVAAMAVDQRRGRILVATPGNLDRQLHFVGNSTVTVLDARTGAIRRTVQVGVGADYIGIDERAGRAFVVNANVNPDGSLASIAAPTSNWPRALQWLRAWLPIPGHSPTSAPDGRGSVTVLDTSRL